MDFVSLHSEELIDARNDRIVRVLKNNRLIVLPGQLLKINNELCPRMPLSLFELALGAANIFLGNSKLIDGIVPPFMTKLLNNGPVARCGGAFCNIYIFRECYLLLIKR